MMPIHPVGAADPERLRAELEQLPELPTPPQVLQEIWQILGSEGTSAGCLSQALEKDTALTAKLLRLANSAYFGMPQPVSEVRTACVVLGFETVRALAVGVSALDSLTRGAGKVIDLAAFWRHSVGTGTAARALAWRLQIPAPGTAFCSGILHDIGKLVLATLSPERYAGLDHAPGGGTLRERETREFGGDHESVGVWLGERWRFPVEIRAAIGFHHEPWNAPEANRWAALLHVADWIAVRQGCPSVPASSHPPEAPDPRASEILAISADILHELGERFAAELEKVETFVELARR